MKLYAAFAYLKAAFDTVNRAKLWKVMEEARTAKYLVARIKELYTETSANVRVGDRPTDI